jgi:hypothetical protein
VFRWCVWVVGRRCFEDGIHVTFGRINRQFALVHGNSSRGQLKEGVVPAFSFAQ